MTRTPVSCLLVTGMTAALAGCGAEGSAVGGGDTDLTNMATTLLSETFGDEGLLEVAADAQGNIGVSVQAKIGSSAEGLLRDADGATTIKDLYTQLKGGTAEIPDRVLGVSDAREEQRHALALRAPAHPIAAPSLRTPAPPVDDDVVVVRSAISSDGTAAPFLREACRNFSSGGAIRYIAVECNWKLLAWSVSTGPSVDSNGLLVDRSYGWNYAPVAGMRFLSASTWVPTIAAYGFGWVEWGGTYSNATASLVHLSLGPKREIGVTYHRAEQHVK